MFGVRWSKVKITADDVIIVCTGPSLKNFDFNNLHNKGHIIAVNDAAQYVPFANSWFTVDPWGLNSGQIPRDFAGTRWAAVPEDYGTERAYANNHRMMPPRNVNYLHRIPVHTDGSMQFSDYLSYGLNEDPSCIHTGNSGFGALGLAYHMKPKRIFLFGIDASRGYFFNEGKSTRTLDHLPALFRSTLPQLEERGIEVINASPASRIDCFPRYTLNAALTKLNKKDVK